MTDNKKVYVNTTDGHWYYFNGTAWIDGGVYQAFEIAKKNVNLEHTSWYTEGKTNILDYPNLLKGIVNKDGIEFPNYKGYHTAYIPVSPNDEYTININDDYEGYFIWTFYDSEKKFLSSNSSKLTVVIPENCYYIILSTGKLTNLNNLMLYKGKESFFCNYYTIDEQYIDPSLLNKIMINTDNINKIKNKIITDDTIYRNFLFDCNSFYKNQSDNAATLEITSSSTLIWEKLNTNPGNILTHKIDLTNYDFEFLELSFNYVADACINIYNKSSWFTSISETQVEKSFNKKITKEMLEAKGALSEYFLQFGINSTSINGKLQINNFKLLVDGKDNVLHNVISELNNKIENIKNSIEIFDKSNPLDNKIENGGLAAIFPRIACIGDSLTIGGMEWDTQGTGIIDYSNFSYPTQIKRALGVEVYNMGSSGACSLEDDTAINGSYNNWNKRAEAMGWLTNKYKADCYIISLGTNDIGYTGEFSGNVDTDINDNDYTNNAVTSVGGYAKIIQKIKELQPRAKIFCVTIPNTRNSLAQRTSANEKIKAIATKFECNIRDLQQYGIQPDDVANWKSIYYNKGHLNCLGYKEYSTMILKYIDFIIKNNPNKFYDVPAIETDYK